MTRNWVVALAVVGGLGSALFAQPYPPSNPQQDPRYQDYPGGNRPGQYAGSPDQHAHNDAYYDSDDSGYDDDGTYAPAPPPMPNYAYSRPVMPGPGYFWVDGYWGFGRGRYSWVGGNWMRPPYAGGYWVAPRYTAGRYYTGYWGGARSNYNRGYVGSAYRNVPNGGRYTYQGGAGRDNGRDSYRNNSRGNQRSQQPTNRDGGGRSGRRHGGRP